MLGNDHVVPRRAEAAHIRTNPAFAGASNQSVPPRISARATVAEVQRQLMSRGYYRGRVDGKYGRQMAFAVRAFQSSAGLPPTGRLDIETVKALGSSDADFAYLAPAASPYQNWMPVKKFKHGKWKMKWKKYYRQPGDERGDEDRQANSEYGWNGNND